MLYLDDQWAELPLRTKGIVLGFEDQPWGQKLNVRWMISNNSNEWRTFSLLSDVDLWRKVGKESIDSDITDKWKR